MISTPFEPTRNLKGWEKSMLHEEVSKLHFGDAEIHNTNLSNEADIMKSMTASQTNLRPDKSST